jgi:hypothetical protein
MQKIFQIAPQVLRELIDGEVVIINMQSGSYYSLMDTGAIVWEMLEQSWGRSDMLDRLVAQYDADADTLAQSLDQLLEQLHNESLILVAEATKTSIKTEDLPQQKQPFTPPTFYKYDDMQELLLVDPIHDVDPAGWPNLQQDIAA